MSRARARRVAGTMNKTEAAYAIRLSGRRWRFEGVTLKLADDCRYTPDFMVIAEDDVIEFHEVKGHWRDDARVKIRVAAEKFPMFRFLAATPRKDGWDFEHFGPKDAA